ncbi:PTS transporter subunit EIIC [Oenococcus sicerae]|uniref:PTS beta-glucoside transporter subunit IIABC n=1 Tax=Oenococcus sicerae TaxID=2203724 RepID=A0AAJ1R983_9LACO|nr:PTS transporter subunit EIIC [Oenococcus sicerae]MDN6900092.1 PTS beta-glucoside transporter subunit IIABC [Oenococcus sicerae]QAS69701.1 PTS transporter subunit EIIC [Oenococcus sicerae]
MAKQDYKKLASDIIDGVGGASNVDKVIHCITRLRFYLKDEKKADTAKVSNLPGIAGAVYNAALGQYQVVIGPAVTDVYDEVVAQLGDSVVDQAATDQAVADTQAVVEKRPTNLWGWVVYAFQLLVGTITGSMIPIIGLLAASGILKGFLTLFTFNLGWIDVKSTTYIIINAMGDSTFYFLPILVGYTAAKQLKSDPIVVAAIGGVLVHPTIAALWEAPVKGMTTLFGIPLNASFFGIPVHIPQYSFSIFPIIFAAWLARPVGNWLKKVLPLSLRSIFQPLFTLFIVTSAVLVLMGPAISLISSGLAAIINFLVTSNEAIAGLVIGAFYQCLVIFGLHWMVIPLISNDIALTGHSVLNGLVNFTMIAQGAGALAVWAKTKKTDIKSLSLAGALSGFAGVTEPAMYGINLKYGRVFWMASIGSAVGAFIAGLMKINMFGFTGSWIGFPSFFSKTNPNNIWIFVIASTITTIVSFVCVYFWGFKDSDVDQVRNVEKKNVFKDAVS